MATNAQIQMLRALDPGVVIPGIDTPTGDPLPTSQLESWTTLTTNSNAPVFSTARPTMRWLSKEITWS
jgi:hypothetical protein